MAIDIGTKTNPVLNNVLKDKDKVDSKDSLFGNPAFEKKIKENNDLLDKDAFLKLFLEQLKSQDPTSPMETNQILEQSALMTQVEQQQQMKQTLEKMTKSIEAMSESSNKLSEFQEKMSEVLEKLGANIGDNNEVNHLLAQLSAYNSSGVVGKIAETTHNSFAITNETIGQPQVFDLWFDEPINLSAVSGGNEDAKVTIYDENGGIVRELYLKDYKDENGNAVDLNGKRGYIPFKWDGKDKSGLNAQRGSYSVSASYNFASDGTTPKTTKIGRGEVVGVAFEGKVPYVKLGKSNSPLNYYELASTTQLNAK